MRTIPPVVVTGAAFTISPGVNRPDLYKRVEIANHSQYLLEAQSGSNKVFVQQFTVAVLEYTSSDPKIYIKPTIIEPLIAGVVSHITATFYEPGEELPNSVYPASLPVYTSAATFIPGTVYLDETFLMTVAMGTVIQNGALQPQPPTPYANLVEIVSYNNTGKDIDVSAWVNDTVGGFSIDQRLALMTVPSGGTNSMQVVGLLSNSGGFRIKYQVRGSALAVQNTIGAKLTGLTL